MWKPRSKLYDSNHHAKTSRGIFSLRKVGAKEWRRRFVFVEGGEICYGKDERRKEKAVPFHAVRGGGAEPEGEMLKEKAPKEAARFGWFLESGAKRIIFACDNEAVWRAWVGFLEALLARLATLRAIPSEPANHSRREGQPPAQARQSLQQRRPSAAGADPLGGCATSPREGESAAPPREDETTNFVDATLDWDHTAALSFADESPPHPEKDGQPRRKAPASFRSSSSSHAGTNDSVEDDSEDDDHAQRNVSRPRRGETPAAAAASTAPDSERANGDSDDDDDDDDVNSSIASGDDDSDEEEELSDLSSSGSEDSGGDRDALAARCVRLRALAATPHSHAAGRLHALAPHFASNDNTTNVVFSAAVDKVARGDTLQPRDLVVTSKNLYLFSKRKMGGGTKSRVVAVGDITGVVESTTSPPLLAILVPSFHDLLIKLPSNTPAWKEELIAHLFVLHDAASCGRCFRFERGTDIGSTIRRKEDDKYDPLASAPGDLTHAAARPGLVPLLRTTGDTMVLWSSIVREVQAGRPPQLSAIVVTDGAFYMLSDTLTKVGRRTALCDVVAVAYERDAQSILIQCSRRATDESGRRQGDALFSVQLASEFTGMLAALRRAAKVGYQRKLKVSASRQLYSHAQLARGAKKGKGDKGVSIAAAGITPSGEAAYEALAAAEQRRKPQSITDRLKSAWKAGVRQETKYMARLRARDGGATGNGRGSGGHETSSDDGLMAAALAGTNASFAFEPDESVSNYLLGGGPQGSATFDGLGSDNAGDEEQGEAAGGAGSPVSAAGMGILFESQYRFVEELICDYDDALALLSSARQDLAGAVARWDRLRLSGVRLSIATTAQPATSAGQVMYSASCQRLSTKAVATVAKLAAGDGAAHEAVFRQYGEPRAVCLTTEGVAVLFQAPKGPSRAPSSSSDKKRKDTTGGAVASAADSRVELFVPWPEVDAVVRCHHQSGAVVGIMTKSSVLDDMALNLVGGCDTADFAEAAATCYEHYGRRHMPRDSVLVAGSARSDSEVGIAVAKKEPPLLPLFAAPRPASVAKALRKLVYDPFPTVALRYTPLSAGSDRLRLAVVPDVAEPCRRFGDNTIYFSGVAWRFRSETLRKTGGVVESDPGPAMNRRHNHLYKSFILVVTNTAVYYCTKGGYEFVRRTELAKVKAVYVSEQDPDTLLLKVPSEYDMYFRVAGRGKELLARLQEAHVEWTDCGLYRPGEVVGSHRAASYFVPVKYTSPIGPLGSLTKPDEFNSIQASRSAAEYRQATEQWHLQYLSMAVDTFQASVLFASGGPRAFRDAEDVEETSLPLPKWAAAKSRLAHSQSLLHFAHRRAFRFGLRADTLPDMARAQHLLERYKGMQAAAEALAEAVASTDPIGYGAAASEASIFPELASLVAEQSVRYQRFLDMRTCLNDILETVDAVGTVAEPDAPASAEQQENRRRSELEALFAKASAMGFDGAVLWELRRYWAVKAQRNALSAWLSGPGSAALLAGNAAAKSLIAAAAWELGMGPVTSSLAPSLSSSSSSASLPPHSDGEEQASRHEEEEDAAKSFVEMATALERTTRDGSRLGVAVLQQGCERAKRLLQQLPETGSEGDGGAKTQAAREALEARVRATEHAMEVLKRHAAEQREVASLSRTMAAHRAANDWDEEHVDELLAVCERLLRALPSDEPALDGERDVVSLHLDTLRSHRHRLALAASFRRQEAAAQQQYEEDLQESAEAARRAEAAKQRSERARRARRQASLLSAWTTHTTRLCEELQAAVAEGAEEPLRHAVKQSVLLQRGIAEAIKAQVATAPGDDAEAADTRRRLREGGEALRARLREAAEKAHDFLVGKHGGRNSANGGNRTAAKEDGSTSGGGDALPEELVRILDVHDSAALIQYIEEHEEELTPGAIAAVRARWSAVARRTAWERRVHQAIEHAHTLGSRELLQQAVSLAATRGFSDEAVERARATLAGGPEVGVDAMEREGTAEREEGGAADDSLVLLGEDDATVDGDDDGEGADATRMALSEGTPDDEPEVRRPSANATGRRGPPAGPAGGDDDIVLASTDASPSPTRASAGADEATPSRPPPVVPGEDTPVDAAPSAAQPQGEAPAATTVDRATVEALLAALPAASSASNAPITPSREPVATCVVQLLSDSVRAVLVHEPTLLRPHSSTASAVGSADASLLTVVDCALARSVLVAWVNVFTDRLKPTGFFTKTPRTVRDVLGFIGDYNVHGDFMAPYTNRVVRDVDREMGGSTARRRSTLPVERGGTEAVNAGSPTAEQQVQRAKTLAYTFVAAMLRERLLEAVVREVTAVGPKVRGDVLLPESVLAQSESLKDLLMIAHVCDALVWPPWSFNPKESAPAAPARSPPPSTPDPSSETPMGRSQPSASCQPSPAASLVQHGPRPTSAAASLAPSSPSKRQAPLPPKLPASPPAAAPPTRSQLVLRCRLQLRDAVAAISTFFTRELARSSEAGPRAAQVPLVTLFDEASHPSVIPVVSEAVVPAMVGLLEAGLVRRYHVFRSRTVWDVLVAFKAHLQMSSRQLAGAEVVSVVELVEVLTATDDGGRRYAAHLGKLSDEELHGLRVRLFLRECLNRQLLNDFFAAFFAAAGEDVVWNGLDNRKVHYEGDKRASEEGLWKFYDPRLCVMLPRDGEEVTEQLWSVVHRIASLPFAVAVDRELR